MNLKFLIPDKFVISDIISTKKGNQKFAIKKKDN